MLPNTSYHRSLISGPILMPKFCIILLMLLISSIHAFHLESKIKNQQQYKASFIPSQQLYSISVIRTASNRQSQQPACHTSNKQITVKTEKQIFRLLQNFQGTVSGTNQTTAEKVEKNREQTIFQKITTLDDDRNIIEEFEVIGNETFIVTTEGKGYFLSANGEMTHIDTLLNLTPASTNQFFNILIRDFKQRALIITPNGVSLCRSDLKTCALLEPFYPINYLFNTEIHTIDAVTYLFLMTGDSVVVYEITAGNQLKNKEVYEAKFFGVDKVHVRNMIRGKGNELLFLDSRRGVVSVNWSGKISQLTTQKLVYQQPGCYQFVGNKQGDEIVLTCTLATKSFFMQKLLRSYSFAQPHYEVIETIFTNDKIYDTAFVDNFIMARIYSGVKLYWTSNNLVTPYPYDYNTAGNIFLHNALQSKLKVLDNGENMIYISTEDEIRQFSLRAMDPYVWCYSKQQSQEQYKVVYSFPCANPTPMQKICETSQDLTYSSWQHAQVKISTMLIPLILSLLGVLAIGLIVMKVYKNTKQDIERARLRYNTENEFGM